MLNLNAPPANTILMVMAFVAFMLALAFHHGMQALVATMLGDTSLTRERRLSFNPVRHMTPFGTVVALVTSFTFGIPAGLGWGRLVRPDARRLRVGPSTGLVLIALTGILSNILLGVGIAFALKQMPPLTNNDAACVVLQGGPLQGCLIHWQPGWLLRIEQFGYIFAIVNIMLGLVNLIPLYPLDGYHILFTLLSANAALSYRNSEQWQELILAGIFFLVPFLLQIARFPFQFSPIGIFQSAGIQIAARVSQGPITFFYLL